MRKDYHMHPAVLARPELFPDFVEQAKIKGIQEICITDHMPLSISAAKDRIPKGKVCEYCSFVRKLAEKYKDEISIKCGIEIDYHPDFTGEIEKVLSQGEFDYILGSSHMHLFTENPTDYTYNDFAKIALENSIKAVETGYFSAVSHLDMYRAAFFKLPLVDDGYDPLIHEDLIKELLLKIEEKDMYLEINPHLAEGRNNDLFYTYPQEIIVDWALKYGLKFSYGSDAHRPQSVGALLEELETHSVYKKALENWEK